MRSEKRAVFRRNACDRWHRRCQRMPLGSGMHSHRAFILGGSSTFTPTLSPSGLRRTNSAVPSVLSLHQSQQAFAAPHHRLGARGQPHTQARAPERGCSKHATRRCSTAKTLLVFHLRRLPLRFCLLLPRQHKRTMPQPTLARRMVPLSSFPLAHIALRRGTRPPHPLFRRLLSPPLDLVADNNSSGRRCPLGVNLHS